MLVKDPYQLTFGLYVWACD